VEIRYAHKKSWAKFMRTFPTAGSIRQLCRLVNHVFLALGRTNGADTTSILSVISIFSATNRSAIPEQLPWTGCRFAAHLGKSCLRKKQRSVSVQLDAIRINHLA
jgi:hypothetical protein